MVLEFWIKNKKLFTIKKCKGKFRSSWRKNCKKLERKRTNSKKSLLLLNKNLKKSKIFKTYKLIKPILMLLASKNNQFNKTQKINKSNKIKVTKRMRITYKIQLKKHR